MKPSTALLLCSSVILISSGITANDEKSALSSKAAIENVHPMESKPLTISVISTTEPTTTSTTASTTTSTTASTTTSTTASTTTSTTASTTTTTTTSTTQTPPHPTPVPDPTKNKWTINGTDGNLIIAEMAVQVVVMYNDTSKKEVSRQFNIPADNKTEVNGTFNKYDETMTLSWKSGGEGDNYVLFHFHRDDKTYSLKNVEILIQPQDLPNSNLSTPLKLVHTHEHFNTSLGNSYRCIKLQNFNLTRATDSHVAGHMKVTDLQFQAFKTDKKTSFGFAEDCAFDTPDVIPIVVGIILAGLVVIVLIAYLISRRRNSGYSSM